MAYYNTARKRAPATKDWSRVTVEPLDGATALDNLTDSLDDDLGIEHGLLFVFGTLLSRNIMQNISGDASMLAVPAVAHGAALYDGGPPILAPCETARTPGLIHILDPLGGEAWRGLDRYEGAPSMYRRLELNCPGLERTLYGYAWNYEIGKRMPADSYYSRYTGRRPFLGA